MRTLLLTFLPDNALVLLIMAAGFGLMLGIISRRAAFGFVGSILLFVLLSPFIDAILGSLPLWLLLILMLFFFLSIGRAVLNTLFGRGATDEFVGHLLWAIFTLPFRFIGYLFGIRRR